jgi:hypothetical protein
VLGHKVKEHPQFQGILFILLFMEETETSPTIPIAAKSDAKPPMMQVIQVNCVTVFFDLEHINHTKDHQ